MSIPQSINDRLSGIVGSEHVRPAEANDSFAGSQCALVVSPGTDREVAAVLVCANEVGLAVIPRGGGTKLEWGNRPRRADVLLSMHRLNQIVEHAWADLTVAVEAGCAIEELQDKLAKQRQRLALDCLWPERATVGGVLSTNDSGVLRLRFGALRDLIIGVTIALADGTLATGGGKVVKNVAGYDLPKLVTGAWGTLGVITRAIFRTHPVCHRSLTLSFATPDLDSMQNKILAIQNSQLAHIALQVRCGSRIRPAGDILFEGALAGLAAQEKQLNSLLGASDLQKSDADNWSAKAQLWNGADGHFGIAKMVVLPTMIAPALCELQRISNGRGLSWQAVMQATGIGWIRVDGAAEPVAGVLLELRNHVEEKGGSLILLHHRENPGTSDSWGKSGDSVPLMRALKNQFDPKGTLNPGRFVGGI